MKKFAGRLMSLMVTAAMVLSMVPVAFAAETANYQTPTKSYEADEWIAVGTVSELKNALSNGGGASAADKEGLVMGVRLTQDITIDKASDSNKTSGTMLYVGYYKENDDDTTTTRAHTVVLDLNGYTLTTTNVERSRPPTLLRSTGPGSAISLRPRCG